METQDDKTPSSSGNHGHRGSHVCHTCGWPFPNHHPSSKQRKAHKRVCGTIDGYRLDNDAPDRTRVESELNSDGEKVVETTISSRSDSGVGRKSSRSARSQEDVFTDAVTEFNESLGAISRETSEGGLQRYHSMQNANELNDTELAEENSTGTLQTVQKVEGEYDKLGAVLGTQDGISTSVPVSVDVALASENAADQISVQPTEPFRELNTVSEINKDIRSPEEVPKEVSILKSDNIEVKGVSEVIDSVSAGISRKATLTENDGVEDNSGRCNDVLCNEVNPPGNSYSPPLQIQVINSSSNARKSDVTEKCDSKIGANESVYVLPVPGVDYKEGNFNLSETAQSTDRSIEYSKASVGDDGGSAINFTKTGDNDRIFSEDVDVLSTMDMWKESIKSADEQDPLLEPNQISDAKICHIDIGILSSEVVKDLKSQNLKEERHTPEETKPKDDKGITTFLDDDGYKVAKDNFAVKNSVFREPAIVDEVPSQDLELVDTPANSNMGSLDITGEAAILKEKEMSGEDDVGNVSTDIGHSNVLSVGGSNENIYYSKATDGITGDIMAGQSQGHSLLTSQCGGEIDGNGENDDKVSDAVLMTGDHLNSTSKLEVDEHAEDFGQNHKFSEKSSCTSGGDEVILQHVTVPAIDTMVDTSSQTSSLDGNWGSASVMSVISDAQPTVNTIVSNHSQALHGEESPSVLLKPVIQNPPCPNQIPVKTEVGIEQMECASEIQTSKEHQNINSVLQTGWTPVIANEPARGNKDKEIVTKVSNWDSGKEHTPLKTLLGEAIARSRSESPIHERRKDEIPATNSDGFSEKADNVILNSNHSEMEVAGEEMGKEWDSPAKYPVKMKSEKRRSKSKPYWVPFLCCSSVNGR